MGLGFILNLCACLISLCVLGLVLDLGRKLDRLRSGNNAGPPAPVPVKTPAGETVFTLRPDVAAALRDGRFRLDGDKLTITPSVP